MSPEQSENSAPRGRAGPSLLHRILAPSVQRNFPDTAVDAQMDLKPKSESAIVAQAPVPEPIGEEVDTRERLITDYALPCSPDGLLLNGMGDLHLLEEHGSLRKDTPIFCASSLAPEKGISNKYLI